jgi:hypothetical protein
VLQRMRRDGGKETYGRADSGDSPGARVATVTGFAGVLGYGSCTHEPYPNTGDPRRTTAVGRGEDTYVRADGGDPPGGRDPRRTTASRGRRDPRFSPNDGFRRAERGERNLEKNDEIRKDLYNFFAGRADRLG